MFNMSVYYKLFVVNADLFLDLESVSFVLIELLCKAVLFTNSLFILKFFIKKYYV